MPTATDPGRLYRLADSYRDVLDARSTNAVDRITRSWLQAQQRVDVEVQALLAKMEAARLAGVEPSPAWLYQQRRLSTVTDTIRAEVERWAPDAEEATRDLARDAVRQGQEHARTLAREAARTGLPGLEATFTDISPENMATMMGHLAPGGPVRDLLVRLGGEAADAAESVLTTGVLLGKGTDWMTRRLATALDVPRWRAETIARTEALRGYRETSRLTYQQSNVVGGWTWRAAIDRRTCAACVVMDGTEHPVTERLDGHPRCRCAMVPRTKTWGDIHPDLADLPDTRPPVRQGKEWLEAQPDTVKRALMGPGKFRAYQAGELTLDDLVARPHSPEWGTMRRERSLIEIREGRNANTLPDATPAPAPTPKPARAMDEPEPDPRKWSGAERDRARKTPGYGNQKTLLSAKTDAELADILADPQVPAIRRLAALDEKEARALAANQLPPGMPKSKAPDSELVKFQKALVTLDDQTVLNQFTHKDPAARFLARWEWKRRAALRPARPNTLEGRLAMKPDTTTPAIGSTEFLNDLRTINRDRWDTGKTEWQVNCTNATTTWELRRRGFDVTAAPRPQLRGRPWTETADAWDADVDDWGNPFTILQAEKRMLKHGEGARGAVSVTWNGGGGHIFNWEVHQGRVVWIDAQTGEMGEDFVERFRRRVSGKLQVFRLDNLPLNDRLEDYIRELHRP